MMTSSPAAVDMNRADGRCRRCRSCLAAPDDDVAIAIGIDRDEMLSRLPVTTDRAIEDGGDWIGAGGVGRDLAEQAVRLVLMGRRQSRGIGVAGLAVAERQSPQAADDDRLISPHTQGSLFDAGRRVRRRECGHRQSC